MICRLDRTTQDSESRGIQVRQPVITPPDWTPCDPEPPYAPPAAPEPEILPDSVEPHGPEHDPDDDPFKPRPSRGR